MVILDASIVTVAVPSAQVSLDISLADRQWIFTAYTLAFGSLLLLGGRVADHVGRKRVFEIGLVGFAAASTLGGMAQDPGTLFGARALQGAFAAFLAPAALSLIQVTFTDTKERAKALGLYGAILGSAMSIGLIVGGMLTEWASWRWTMLVNVPIAVVALVGSRLVVRESRAGGEAHYDVAGTVAVTAGLVSLVYGFTTTQSDGWGSGTTLSFLGAGIVLLVAFVVIEARSAFPLLPLRLLTDRTRGGTLLAMFLTIAALFSTFLLLTFYLQGILGYSALRTGIAYLPYSVGTFVGARVAAPSSRASDPCGSWSPACCSAPRGWRCSPGSAATAASSPTSCPRRSSPAWGWGSRSSRSPRRPSGGSTPPTPEWPVPWSTPPSRSAAPWASPS